MGLSNMVIAQIAGLHAIWLLCDRSIDGLMDPYSHMTWTPHAYLPAYLRTCIGSSSFHFLSCRFSAIDTVIALGASSSS